jgi:hypothetical protein
MEAIVVLGIIGLLYSWRYSRWERRIAERERPRHAPVVLTSVVVIAAVVRRRNAENKKRLEDPRPSFLK